MRIIVFYDNFIRDYRGALLLKEILKSLGAKVKLHALWDHAIEKITQFSPDSVVMGQIGEISTSKIALFCYHHGINLILNTSETTWPIGKLNHIFSYNFCEWNDKYIDLQVLVNTDMDKFITLNDQIKDKNKYKFIGFPRIDLSINSELKAAELETTKQKYDLHNYKKIFLYISSFIYDECGGQVSKENEKDMNVKVLLSEEQILKQQHTEILSLFLNNYIKTDSILLIKKHPWDKSNYFNEAFRKTNCIILDNNAYVSTLITLSDFILHSNSTVAIEAWVQNKKTISIMPFFDGNRDKLHNHMKYEIIVKNYQELLDTLNNYPAQIPGKKYLATYEPFLDGKSTIRLAREILKLPRKQTRKLQAPSFKILAIEKMRQTKNFIKKIFKKHDLVKTGPDVGYGYYLESIEQSKDYISQLYLPVIKSYIKKNITQ